MRTRRRISTVDKTIARRIVSGLTCLVVFLPGTIGAGRSADRNGPPFNPADYPKSEFQVTQSIHWLGSVGIRIVHAKRRKESATPPSYCRAWVEITRDGALLRRIYYRDFEPVGDKYGVFSPIEQPSADYFVLVKEGDYDGRLLLVNKSGEVTDILGGSFFVAGKRFLVSEYSSDSAGLAVFDLESHKLEFQTTTIPYVQQWYKDGLGYFFTESEWSGASGVPHEKVGVAYRLNLEQGTVNEIKVQPAKLKAASEVKYDFDPRQYEDCVSR
jgi:hypothetical protein